MNWLSFCWIVSSFVVSKKYIRRKKVGTYYKAINWNEIEDAIDKSTWEKLTEQFWLDTRIPLSNDLDDWRKLSVAEKDLVGKVFGGLTLLDTMQSQSGVN
jgi:ribonucleoside-diphosphate reductase, beta subunit